VFEAAVRVYAGASAPQPISISDNIALSRSASVPGRRAGLNE
jgi:hypothetical protein